MTSKDGASSQNYCETYELRCLAAGALIVGGVAAAIIVANNNNSGPAPVVNPVQGSGVGMGSDLRLKQNVRHVETLDSGIRLYAFQYNGSAETFVGVMAQDLVDDVRFSNAVTTGQDGFMRVDYAKLGLRLVNGMQMKQAGERAAANAG